MDPTGQYLPPCPLAPLHSECCGAAGSQNVNPVAVSGGLCCSEKKAAAAKLHPLCSSQNNSNPAEDLRRTPPGLLALDNMVYFSRHTPNAYSRVRALPGRTPWWRGAGGSPPSFPVSVTILGRTLARMSLLGKCPTVVLFQMEPSPPCGYEQPFEGGGTEGSLSLLAFCPQLGFQPLFTSERTGAIWAKPVSGCRAGSHAPTCCARNQPLRCCRGKGEAGGGFGGR